MRSDHAFGPVTDWATDFDLFDPAYVTDPAPIWRDLRERCPVARTERRGTTWLPVDYGDLRAIAQDTERFSSRDVGVATAGRGEGETPAKLLTAPPITSDPPMHTWTRRMLLARFGPPAIEAMTPITQRIADELIDGFEHAGCDRRRHQLRPAHPGTCHRHDDRHSTRRRGSVHGLGCPHPPARIEHLDIAAEGIREVLAYFADKLAERAAPAPRNGQTTSSPSSSPQSTKVCR